jgi:endonuclease/exonuclease/phosphatase (EEP) superfamily protein YafD
MSFTMIDLLTILVAAAAAAASLATLSGFFSRLWWVFDLFTHFRFQYMLTLLGAALILIVLGHTSLAALAGFFAGINLALIAPLYLKPFSLSSPSNSAKVKSFRMLMANVLQPNQQHRRLAEVIQANNPDLIVLIEINQEWMNALAPTLAEHSHRLVELREDHYGLGIFSRFPIIHSQVVKFIDEDMPALIAEIDLEGQALTVAAVHPPPPKSALMASQRNRYFNALAGFAARHEGRLLIAGDLNSSSWSPHFTRLLEHSGLSDSRQGFGMQLSWPAGRPHMLTSIDHVLVSPDVRVRSRRLGPKIGSDHYPIILDFSV